MLVGDSIQTQVQSAEPLEENGEMLLKENNTAVIKLRHPYQILRTLPKDATPAQQDSAIQAAFQPEKIHYSNKPDTLRLPGQPLGKSLHDVSLPQYYKQTYFESDSLLHPEINGGRMGIAGDPVPYLVSNDTYLTGLLMIFLIGTILMVSRSIRFILYQFKVFFYGGHQDSFEQKETAGEMNYQFILCFQTMVLVSLAFYYMLVDTSVDTYVLSDYELMGLFCLATLGCFAIKMIFSLWANWTFFSKRQISEFNHSELFLTALEGVILLPIILLYTFFDAPLHFLLVSTIFVLFFVKLLVFYKSYCIFFQGKAYFLQFFLYFCTLEIAPLATLSGTLVLISQLLKITY